MIVVFRLISIVVGIITAVLYFRRRESAAPDSGEQQERELKAMLDEIRELRTEIDILKANPTIGEAVKAALKYAEDQPDFSKSTYNVAAPPTKLPTSAYDVLVRPNPLRVDRER